MQPGYKLMVKYEEVVLLYCKRLGSSTKRWPLRYVIKGISRYSVLAITNEKL